MEDSSRSDEDQSRTHNVGVISCSAYSVSQHFIPIEVGCEAKREDGKALYRM